jgi:EAL domain-containing protein (putative c-di-GMP-specific phosphodiesterase class I)
VALVTVLAVVLLDPYLPGRRCARVLAGAGEDRMPLVKAVIDLAVALEPGTVAEGVETPEQALPARLGCERAPDWHDACPAPAGEVARLLAAGRREAIVLR